MRLFVGKRQDLTLSLMDDHIDRHPGLREDASLITSIPGLGNTTAAKVLAYLGDVKRFKNAKALAAFVGAQDQRVGEFGARAQHDCAQRPCGRASRDVHAGHGCVAIQPADESFC